MRCARCAIYGFANCSIVFSGWPWLIYRAGPCCSTLPPKITIFRGLSGDFVLLSPQKHRVHFPNLGGIRMACWRISGRTVTAERAPLRLPYKWTAVWCCLHWQMCAKLRHICSNGVFYSLTLTGTSSLATLWNRIKVANWPTELHLLGTWSRSQTLAGRWKSLGYQRLNKGCCWAVIVWTENKDSSNLFTTFIRFIFFYS